MENISSELINERNEQIKNLIPSLIESFVEYYGEAYREHIETTINSITFVYFTENNSKYEYYGISNEKRISDKITKENIKSRIKKLSNTNSGVLSGLSPYIIALNINEKLNIHDLIHEINHVLHNKEDQQQVPAYPGLSILITKSIFYEGITNVDGITDDTYYNLTYEIINEYMSIDILDIFNANNPNQAIGWDKNNSLYNQIDNLIDQVIEKMYNEFKEDIKHHLINCEGKIIKYKMGEENYKCLNTKLHSILISDQYINELKKEIKDLMSKICLNWGSSFYDQADQSKKHK